MVDDLAGPIPGVDDKELDAAVRGLPNLPIIRAEDSARFTVGVRDIAERRAQTGWPNEGEADFSAFVLVPHPREAVQRFKGVRVLDLLSTRVPVLGRVFFLNRDATNGGFVNVPTDNPAEVTDWLADNGLGSCPLVMIYRAEKSLVVRPKGLASDAQYDSIRDTPPKATLAELLEALDHFHRKKILTPHICPRGVWEKGRASQYVPGPTPEKSIQTSLADGLNMWFHGVVRAEMEDTIDVGRIDVRLLTGKDGLRYWAIIELKVIKSSRNATKKKPAEPVTISDNAEAVAEGIRQAWAFRENRLAAEGLLEVYDLRKDKTEDVFKHAIVRAALEKWSPLPTYNVRPAFGASSDARKAQWF